MILLSTLPIDKKLKARKHSPAFSKGKHSFGKEGQLENHIGKVQIQATKSDDPNKYKSFIPTDMHIAREDSCVNDTDIPERMQVMISKCLLVTNILMSMKIFDLTYNLLQNFPLKLIILRTNQRKQQESQWISWGLYECILLYFLKNISNTLSVI